jgi:hypothetical protein
MQGPNRLPPTLDLGAAASLARTYASLSAAAAALGRGISLALTDGARDDTLQPLLDGGETISILRLFRYFDRARASAAGAGDRRLLGSSEHTDWGFLCVPPRRHTASARLSCSAAYAQLAARQPATRHATCAHTQLGTRWARSVGASH